MQPPKERTPAKKKRRPPPPTPYLHDYLRDDKARGWVDFKRGLFVYDGALADLRVELPQTAEDKLPEALLLLWFNRIYGEESRG